MIGVTPHPPPQVFHPTTTGKRLASTRQELERSWHSSGHFSTSARAHVLHSISCSADEDDTDRSFKRQRTNESVDIAVRSIMNPVNGVRINPDNRPPKPLSTTIKAGWYSGHLDYMGNRHGMGCTQHDDGSSYEGSYANDVMEGWGKYTFTTMKQLVSLEGRRMHRTTERVFTGNFVENGPSGKGVMTTTVIDSDPSMEIKYVKVIHDVGYYKHDGRCVGEGVRFAYTRSWTTGWEERYTRTNGGVCTGVNVTRGYGEWVCDCLGLEEYPVAPSL
jgi:hypothetical protein